MSDDDGTLSLACLICTGCKQPLLTYLLTHSLSQATLTYLFTYSLTITHSQLPKPISLLTVYCFKNSKKNSPRTKTDASLTLKWYINTLLKHLHTKQ